MESVIPGQRPRPNYGHPHGDGQVEDYPILTPGQSVTVREFRIEVQSDDGDTHTVTISKVSAE